MYKRSVVCDLRSLVGSHLARISFWEIKSYLSDANAFRLHLLINIQMKPAEWERDTYVPSANETKTKIKTHKQQATQDSP